MKAKYLSFVLLFVLSLGLDQATKVWARHDLKPRGQARDERRLVVVIPGYFDLRYSEARGSAFGLFRATPRARHIHLGISLLVMGLTFGWLYKVPGSGAWLGARLGLLLGGAIGNSIDRLRFGGVTDFLVWKATLDVRVHEWPAFNVADAAIVLGTVHLLLNWPVDAVFRIEPADCPAQESDRQDSLPARFERGRKTLIGRGVDLGQGIDYLLFQEFIVPISMYLVLAGGLLIDLIVRPFDPLMVAGVMVQAPVFIIVIFVYMQNNNDIRLVRNEIRARRDMTINSVGLLEVNSGQYETIFLFLKKISSLMNIDIDSISIRLDLRSPGYLPSIVEKDDKNVLLLPVGFLVLVQEEPEQARAMVAHEFAHVLQRDANLWIITDAWATKFSNYASNLKSALALAGLVALASLLRTGLLGVAVLPLFTILAIFSRYTVYKQARIMYVKIKNYRMRSEDNADLAGVIFGSGSALVAAIHEYVDDKVDEIHRPRQQRISRVQALCAPSHV